MTKNLTVEQIKAILDRGNFDELITAVEDDQIECKSAPYQLNEAHQKQELAKDVSGFANANGGVILIGVRTERSPMHFGDEIKEIRPFPRRLVDPNQYQAIIRSWIYPAPQQVDIRWFPSVVDREKGIMAIIIPDQIMTRRPFLIKRTVDDRGKCVEVVFGYVERQRANVNALKVEEIHALIKDGLRFDQVHQQYEDIQEMLQELIETQRAEGHVISLTNADELLNSRISEALWEVNLMQNPAYILTATPTQPVEIPTLFERRDAEVVRLMENPPELRHSGFDLNTGAPAKIVQGKLRRAVSPGYKILDLWREGTLIFASAGGPDFLCWGRKAKHGEPLRINPLVLTESLYLFVELVKKVFEHAQPKPKEITYTLQLRNMSVNGTPCGLIPGPLETLDWKFGTNVYSAPDSRITITGKDSDPQPGVVSFKLVAELYNWFGLENDKIPYVEKINDHFVISPDLIQKAGG